MLARSSLPLELERMSANHHSAGNEVGASKSGVGVHRRIAGWKWLVAALGVGVAIGAGLALVRRSPHATSATSPPLSSRPDATWPAHARHAPDFRLVDQTGAPISLRLFRGRPVILTFIDPLCRTLCPFEARVLTRVVSSMAPAKRPAVIAVSVNPWGDSRANFREDGRRWQLVPEWRWAAGSYKQLAAVWNNYKIGVRVRKRVFAGIAVHEVDHTEASFIIDPAGYQRALYLYPFRADDVARTVGQLVSARS
jgi:cytochrome oxidase Cu insertion factor (SCO1/SenC/PrrC family)